jgi:hypothetical protein
MKLGQMLLRDGRITPAQIDAAVAQQTRTGGRFGTVLFEMGFVDADTLTVYLGLELGIPIATRGVLDRAKRAAVRMLTPELAERFLCVPLVLQDRQLIAAIRDPHDLIALDELGNATTCRIIPRVAPEIRLYYYVERYFGVPRPARYRALGDRVVEQRRVTADTVEAPPPPLPGLPPPVRDPVVPPPLPAPPLRTVQEEEDAEALAIEMEADAAEAAEVVPAEAVPVAKPSKPPAKASARRPAPPPAPPTSTTPVAEPARQAPPPPPAEAVAPAGEAGPKAIELDEAMKRMQEASTRADVADALLAFARGLFDVCALLVVRDDLAFGWKGFGPDLDIDRIEAMLIPLEAQSIFKMALEENDLFAGAAPPSAIHGYLFKVLRTAPPQQAVVAPVVIRDRVVNLLYGHKRDEGELIDTDLDALRLVSRQAAAAYARLITAQKKHG